MPKKRFSAEQIVTVLRQIEVLMSQGKAAPVACREVRLMTLIDEFTRECLAIRVARWINSFGVSPAIPGRMATGVLRRPPARRVPQRGNLPQSEGGYCRHRAMAQPLQYDPTALIFGLPATRTANIVANNAPSGSEHSDAIISVPLVQNIRQLTVH